MTRRCSSYITPQSTSNMHSGALSMDPLSRKKVGMTSYTISAEYEPRPFDAALPEGSTRLDCLSRTDFWRRCSNKFPKLIIKSKTLDVYYACYIFLNYCKILDKYSYKKSDDFIDNGDDVVYGYGNDLDVVTDVELEVQNTQYTKSKRHVLLTHFQIIQADDLKERCKNQIIHTKAQQSCITIYYVTVTMDMCQNIFFSSFKGEHPEPAYYLSPANIYVSCIHCDSNNICSVYTWTEFEGNKGMNNIAFCLL